MSLAGVRSLSLIETPPVDRYPIQTYVLEENKNVIKDAIYKELARDGQVFILYNDIGTMDNKKRELELLVPEAKIIHLEGMSCDTSERRERMKNVSKKIYYSKTQSKFNYRLSSFLFKIYACLRLTLYKLIGNSKKYNYWNIVLDNL
jgi:RecG-like helicase